MVPGHSRGEVGMASSPGGYLVPRCAHARLGFGILLPCQGPLPAWPGHTRRRLLYVAEKSWPKRQPLCPWDVPGTAWPAAEDEDEEVGAP